VWVCPAPGGSGVIVIPSTVDGGGCPTTTVTPLDVACAPELSVARAVSAYEPVPTPLHEKAYGALVSPPIHAPLA
jgi:hypothetical protein